MFGKKLEVSNVDGVVVNNAGEAAMWGLLNKNHGTATPSILTQKKTTPPQKKIPFVKSNRLFSSLASSSDQTTSSHPAVLYVPRAVRHVLPSITPLADKITFTSPAKTPAKYQLLFQAGVKNFLLEHHESCVSSFPLKFLYGMRAVLSDYANNKFLRCHWNRHHCAAVNFEVKKISEILTNSVISWKTATLPLYNLIKMLKQHPKYNPTGSLAKRLAFLTKQQEKMVREEEKLPRYTTQTGLYAYGG